jgi:hypothetical protein
MCYEENGTVKFLETLAGIYLWLKGNILALIYLSVIVE